ncbi:MAG: hypothetical protein U1B94_11365 [candidate division NC10 bacterium]|nr:hypothetical protein [candidate division NC10 bacterium]
MTALLLAAGQASCLRLLTATPPTCPLVSVPPEAITARLRRVVAGTD